MGGASPEVMGYEEKYALEAAEELVGCAIRFFKRLGLVTAVVVVAMLLRRLLGR